MLLCYTRWLEWTTSNLRTDVRNFSSVGSAILSPWIERLLGCHAGKAELHRSFTNSERSHNQKPNIRSQILHDFAIFIYSLVRKLFKEILFNDILSYLHWCAHGKTYAFFCTSKFLSNYMSAMRRLTNLKNITCSESSAGFVGRLRSNVQGKSWNWIWDMNCFSQRRFSISNFFIYKHERSPMEKKE